MIIMRVKHFPGKWVTQRKKNDIYACLKDQEDSKPEYMKIPIRNQRRSEESPNRNLGIYRAENVQDSTPNSIKIPNRNLQTQD